MPQPTDPPSVPPRARMAGAWPVAPADGLPPNAQRLMVTGIVGLHILVAWGLMQVREVREAVVSAAPLLFEMIAPEQPKPPVPPPPRPVTQKAPPPQPAPVIAAAPSPAPAPFVVAPPPVEPPPPAPVQLAAPAPTPPAPPPPLKTIAASEVQFLRTPVLEFPAASRRARESGRVTLRLFIDEAGQPRQVQVSRSSGFVRLDEAAVATMNKALFKPYTENGQPIGVWAVIPLDFSLER